MYRFLVLAFALVTTQALGQRIGYVDTQLLLKKHPIALNYFKNL